MIIKDNSEIYKVVLDQSTGEVIQSDNMTKEDVRDFFGISKIDRIQDPNDDLYIDGRSIYRKCQNTGGWIKFEPRGLKITQSGNRITVQVSKSKEPTKPSLYGLDAPAFIVPDKETDEISLHPFYLAEYPLITYKDPLKDFQKKASCLRKDESDRRNFSILQWPQLNWLWIINLFSGTIIDNIEDNIGLKSWKGIDHYISGLYSSRYWIDFNLKMWSTRYLKDVTLCLRLEDEDGRLYNGSSIGGNVMRFSANTNRGFIPKVVTRCQGPSFGSTSISDSSVFITNARNRLIFSITDIDINGSKYYGEKPDIPSINSCVCLKEDFHPLMWEYAVAARLSYFKGNHYAYENV